MRHPPEHAACSGRPLAVFGQPRKVAVLPVLGVPIGRVLWSWSLMGARLDFMQSVDETTVFFYGTFMDPDVLVDEFGVCPLSCSPARLDGHRLSIEPRVNIEPDDDAVVYGSVLALRQSDVDELYAGLEAAFGIRYRPVTVEVVGRHGERAAALVYRADSMAPAQPDAGYVRQLADCCRGLGHPEAYARFIESLLDR